MTQEELQIILSGQPDKVIQDMQVSDLTLPQWKDLQKEYFPMQHEIMTNLIKYPQRLENGQDRFQRTPLGLQKLAVNRLAQSMFATPVKFKWIYDNEDENQKLAVDVLNHLYTVDNYINGENIERAKAVNACCQCATIWRVVPVENYVVKGIPTKFKLKHKTYSEMEGYKLYPRFTEDGDLLALSISYKGLDKKERFDIYTANAFHKYVKQDKWIAESGQSILFMPLVYTWIQEPVWGGQEGTKLVEQLEEMESFQGNYIAKNSVPTFYVDWGETQGRTKVFKSETSTDFRHIITVGKDGKVQDVTWQGASESVSQRYARIRNAFFEQVQIPDISFATLINSRTSAENKELLFSDVKQKAKDLGTEWETLLVEEIEIVKQFAKVMFPSLAASIDLITCTCEVVPYSIKTKKETAEYISLAGDNMSLVTKVRLLDEVEDIDAEVERIESGNSVAANQGF